MKLGFITTTDVLNFAPQALRLEEKASKISIAADDQSEAKDTLLQFEILKI